jgi:hypothetical protein
LKRKQAENNYDTVMKKREVIGFLLRVYEAFGDTHEQLTTCKRVLERTTLQTLENEAVQLGFKG